MDRASNRRRNPGDKWTFEALERGDVAAVMKRVADDADYLESRDFVGHTPLMTAIVFGHVELVEFLLGQGADPDADADDGEPPLFLAIDSERPESASIVSLLIEAEADIHVTGKNGWTPLHLAACLGRLEQARLLLEEGADIDERATIDDERTPLMEAAHQGLPAMVRLLLEHGADPSLRDSIAGRDAIQTAEYASRGADPDTIDVLREVYSRPIDDSFIDDLDVEPDVKEAMRAELANVDMVENYRQAADLLAKKGDHDGVIRIIEAFKAG
ncbi:ankyrin repeat domain-containing protein [Singulisphaera sp. PoT]|uniref:ankyrin repeat domain-containing protein n=1 Tax=Singulisphaera sp. PoT TaxID=3411797 RepID=UPI003BF4C3EF